jgi:LysM repeat protein
MNNPNPFVPQGSLLELQSRRRSRLKLAVFCVLAVSVTGLTAMLIQGCKRTVPDSEVPPPIDTNTTSVVDTNFPPFGETSNTTAAMPPVSSNTTAVLPPLAPIEPVAPVAPVAPAGSEYVVVKGDTLAGIAKKHGVTLNAIEAANPGVVPTKLKIGQKLVIPAGGSTGGTIAPTAASSLSGGSETVYTVKPGDTLTKIAKAFGTTYKAIQSANGLTTTSIKVGQKVKIPSKAEPAPLAPVAPAPAPAPVMPMTPAPALPPVSTPPPFTTVGQ